MDYRATTDELYAKRKTDLLRCEILCKRVRSRVMVTEEGAMDLRKAKAEGHPDVIAADESLCGATIEFERLRASRETADMLIEAFRTVEASRRKL